MTQFTIMSGPERRRRWSIDQKRALVEESMVAGASIAAIARAADIQPGLIYRWRRELTGAKMRQPTGFASVAIVPDAHGSDLSAAMLISVGGATVRVPNGTSPQLLAVALRELKT